MNIKENKLYTNFSQAFALFRSGAILILHNSKAWTLEGILTDSISPYAFISAYTIHDLMNANFKHGVDIPITGNSKNDIAFAVHKIVSEIMKTNRFPFRVWNGKSYVSVNPIDQYMVDCTGRLRLIKKIAIGGLKEVEVPEYYEVEEFTGFFDKFKVPIFRNDIVLFEDKQFKIVKTLEWELAAKNELKTISLYENRNSCSVLGSYRMPENVLDQIASIIKIQ